MCSTLSNSTTALLLEHSDQKLTIDRHNIILLDLLCCQRNVFRYYVRTASSHNKYNSSRIFVTNIQQHILQLLHCWSSSSRMRVINHNWSATKQRPHPQSEPR